MSINIRLSPSEMAYILEHSGATLLVATREFADAAASTLAEEAGIRLVVEDEEYDAWLAEPADPARPAHVDERSLLAINYTSGTTGRPKGVMYHHRGAALQAPAMAYHARLGPGGALPVDAADVPLQRLVLHLGGDRRRRHPRVPAGGRHRRDLAAAPDRGHHPLQRRADRAHDDRRGPGRRPARRGGCTSTPVARRRRPHCWRGWTRSASTSPTSTGSPRRSARSRSTSGSRSGTTSTPTRGRGCGRARASAT